MTPGSQSTSEWRTKRDGESRNASAAQRISGPMTTSSGETWAPMIMRTFIDQLDLSGMTIYPFLTYAVGAGSIVADYRDFCSSSTIGKIWPPRRGGSRCGQRRHGVVEDHRARLMLAHDRRSADNLGATPPSCLRQETSPE